ncbi:MAG TPA: peptidoglycan glycosyltransferase [Lachnospiraceae bacterium]|nr:peptidoglycan glycosyltransferase [Lachnospiraceae bacterium]
MTYLMVLIFLGLFGHLIYFMVHDAKKIIADPHNKRQDYYSEYIIRGDIVSADGQVLATTVTDEDGNEERVYPYKDVFAHVVGYNDYGRSGIELDYNFELLTTNVNIVSRLKNDLKSDKNPGDTICTTLDSRLQQEAYDALGDASGAVVVIEPSTGKILAMVSKPSFDPNYIDEVWDYIHSDEGSESTIMLNRATQGLYAPGSTFKIVTALEYIRENPKYENYSYECEGVDIYNGVEIGCSDGHVHGTVDLKDSVAYSCNTSFANIGMKLDKSSYRKTAEDLLFNSKLPVDIDYSESSFVIDKNTPSDQIPQTAIGQGDTNITPLHNAMIMCAIANGGILKKPYLVDSIKNVDGAVVEKIKSSETKELMNYKEAEALIDMLTGVCEYGTASYYFAYTDYSVAGKTGTAEYDNNGNCNSWFVGFSNVEDPDIVVSVIVEDYTENQLSGSYVAKRVFDAYYDK